MSRRIVLRAWYALIRQMDILILWPNCKRKTISTDYARQAFMQYALNDDAWAPLGQNEIGRRVRELK